MDGPSERIIGVGVLTREIKSHLEARFRDVWVRGEVSNLRRQSSGHLYFSLKDRQSQISAVMFRGDAVRFGSELRDGVEVILAGRVTVYEPRGNYQLVARFAQDDGEGRLRRQFEALKAKLAGEGLFAVERKRRLPRRVRQIGIVTSATGAALRDFVNILRRRGWLGRVLVFPSSVQGAEAAVELERAIGLANGRFPELDVLVVGRGGGSLEDLWPFNEEGVARAVAGSRLPVVSAVGHETDVVLTDFVADVRAETPSAAAEMITSGWLEASDRLVRWREELERNLEGALENRLGRIDTLRRQLRLLSPRNRLEQAFQRLDEIRERLDYRSVSGMKRLRDRLGGMQERFLRADPVRVLDTRRRHLEQVRLRLEGMSPDRVVKRGFVMMATVDGEPVTECSGVAPGDSLVARFQDGDLRVTAERLESSR